MKTEENPHFFPMDKKIISPHIEKLIGKQIQACALFSSKLAHDTQPVCFIAQLFWVYAIHKYFISMPTPAMGSVISQISNRWYFVSFGTLFF